MIDPAHRETDALIAEMEKRIRKEYGQATREVQAKLDDYLRRFEIKDKKWRQWVADGKRTQAEYLHWRTGQIAIGKRWEEMRDTLAQDLHNANVIARSIATEYSAEAYALNHDYAAFLIERDSGVNTSYTCYPRDTVARIIREQPKMLPDPGESMKRLLRERPDLKWQAGQIQSVTTQAILQGESIPNVAKRIARTMGEHNHKATVRYCRTAVTAAENAGRIHAMQRGASMGIKMEKQWIATLDNRTRHWHRQLDGVSVPIDDPFVNDYGEIRYPGDPDADPANLWNCRCTLISHIAGFEIDTTDLTLRNTDHFEDQSYEEWREGHGVSRDILHQEKVGEAIRAQYIREYREG